MERLIGWPCIYSRDKGEDGQWHAVSPDDPEACEPGILTLCGKRLEGRFVWMDRETATGVCAECAAWCPGASFG